MVSTVCLSVVCQLDDNQAVFSRGFCQRHCGARRDSDTPSLGFQLRLDTPFKCAGARGGQHEKRWEKEPFVIQSAMNGELEFFPVVTPDKQIRKNLITFSPEECR